MLVRPFLGLCALALACTNQLVAGAGFLGNSNSLRTKRQLFTSQQIADKLNSAILTPEETIELLSSQEPTKLGPIFKSFYADELEQNAFAVPADCFDSVLFNRWRLCEMLDMANDGSLAHENLSRFCWDANEAVVSFCADKMNPAGPKPKALEFGLFKEVAARNPGANRLSTESLVETLGAEALGAEYVYLALSLAADKQAKVADGQTVQDFLKLNQFTVAQCMPAALQKRSQFCSKVAPSDETSANNYKINLATFCRATHQMAAHYCGILITRYPNWSAQLDPSLSKAT